MKNPVRKAAVSALALLLSSPVLAQVPGQDPLQDDASAPAMAMGSGRMVRGTVSAVTSDKLSLKTESGDTYTVALTPNTRIMKGRETARANDVHVGDGIGAMGELDPSSKTVHALFISLVDAEQVKKMRDSLGRTWIAGKITAIDDLKLTILRGDKVSQVIAVDEGTSFKRGGRGMRMMMQNGDVSGPLGGDFGGQRRNGAGSGPPRQEGESITLADIKVGDNVAGQGALKNGTFIPTELAVTDPSQRRRRQGNPGDPAASTEPK